MPEREVKTRISAAEVGDVYEMSQIGSTADGRDVRAGAHLVIGADQNWISTVDRDGSKEACFTRCGFEAVVHGDLLKRGLE